MGKSIGDTVLLSCGVWISYYLPYACYEYFVAKRGLLYSDQLGTFILVVLIYGAISGFIVKQRLYSSYKMYVTASISLCIILFVISGIFFQLSLYNDIYIWGLDYPMFLLDFGLMLSYIPILIVHLVFVKLFKTIKH